MKAGFREFRSGLGELLRRGVVAYAVLLISLVLAGLAWQYVSQNLEARSNAQFEETVQETELAIDRRVEAYVNAMFGARALFYASNTVERQEWAGYVNSIELGGRFASFQALGYAERVTPLEREAFFGGAREEGLPGLRPDLRPGGEREAYFPVKFVEPRDDANETLLHYDLYTVPHYRSAMNRARDTNTPQATGMAYVLTEAAPDSPAHLALRPGFLMFLPVYHEGEPMGTVQEKRRSLRGFIVGAVRMDELLKGLFGEHLNPTIDFEVYDGKDLSSSALLYDDDGVLRAGDPSYSPLFSELTTLEVAGQKWNLYFSTLPGFVSDVDNSLPMFVLLSGIAISLVLFGITWMLAASRERAERASAKLEEANHGLEAANQELEAFSYSVSHDLRSPLRSIEGFSQILTEDFSEELGTEARGYLGRIRFASQRMAQLIDDLLLLSRVTRAPLRKERVDLSALAREVIADLERRDPDRDVEFFVAERLNDLGDARLLRVALENLLGNAWKFTSKNKAATIEFGVRMIGGIPTYFVRDNGAGFEMAYSDKLFGAFQRLHTEDEFEGTGIGLATVARIVRRHGGRVWAEGEVGKGATFYFTLGDGYRREPPGKPAR